jgi:predicted lactoylglutathione lyase
MKKAVKNNLILELHVPDLNTEKDFYSKLGFKVSMYDKPNDTEQGYVSMIREDDLGSTMINFYGGDERVYSQSFFKQFPKDTRRGYEVGIVIPVSNIDEVYKTASTSLKQNIVREIKELQDHELKWKDFRMEDPFGYYIRITELIDWGQ